MCDHCGCSAHGESISIPVKGMSCQHCVDSVTKALNDLGNVHHVQVDLAAGQVSFALGEGADLATVKNAINDLGFEA